MFLFDAFVAIGPVIGYVDQLRKIKASGQLGSFSIDVCAILLISSILRIFFWLTIGFAANLLFQSFFIIVIQIMLLQICIQIRNKNAAQISSFRPFSFWRWKTFDQYIKFLLGLTSGMTILTLISKIIYIPYYGDSVGFISLVIEATLGIPQLVSNHLTKSVKGLSLFMIASWFFGDFTKTLYFIFQSQPSQFVMCGTIQLIVDILIVGQIIVYSKSNKMAYKPINDI